MEAPQRVQSFSTNRTHLPPQYIQPPDLRPSASSTAGGGAAIPVIDLAAPDPSPAIAGACKNWGAFQLVNHGVAPNLLASMRANGLRFFSAPMEEKLRFSCDPHFAASEGYGSRMLEKEDGVLDWRDYFDHHTLPLERRNSERWPDFIPHYRDVVAEYSKNMKELAQKLLHMISESLGLPPSYIEGAVGEVYQNITVSYYSPCPQPELALGLQSHSDMGAITLLIQDDVGGLEVIKDGAWVPVVPLPDAIIVLLADQTEIISNGQYKSAVHRAVVNAHRARLSVATFYDPAKARKIYPAPSLVTQTSPLKYRRVTYGDYVKSWYGEGPEGKRNIETLLIQ